MTPSMKKCPKCGAVQTISQLKCSQCDHTFRTSFVAPTPSPSRITQSITTAAGTMKTCPECGLATQIHARSCLTCDHQFRTRFVVTPPPVSAPPVVPFDPVIAARSRQAQAVLQDPKYLVDTGLGVGCPHCGSANVTLLQKQGTGLGYFGSIQFVLAATLVESAIAARRKQPAQCGYCGSAFELAY